MSNWKCILNFHKWGKTSFTSTHSVKECECCHKTVMHMLPLKVILYTTAIKTLLPIATVGVLYALGYKDLAVQLTDGLTKKGVQE